MLETECEKMSIEARLSGRIMTLIGNSHDTIVGLDPSGIMMYIGFFLFSRDISQD
jgi:hypothetical protein